MGKPPGPVTLRIGNRRKIRVPARRKPAIARAGFCNWKHAWNKRPELLTPPSPLRGSVCGGNIPPRSRIFVRAQGVLWEKVRAIPRQRPYRPGAFNGWTASGEWPSYGSLFSTASCLTMTDAFPSPLTIGSLSSFVEQCAQGIVFGKLLLRRRGNRCRHHAARVSRGRRFPPLQRIRPHLLACKERRVRDFLGKLVQAAFYEAFSGLLAGSPHLTGFSFRRTARSDRLPLPVELFRRQGLSRR